MNPIGVIYDENVIPGSNQYGNSFMSTKRPTRDPKYAGINHWWRLDKNYNIEWLTVVREDYYISNRKRPNTTLLPTTLALDLLHCFEMMLYLLLIDIKSRMLITQYHVVNNATEEAVTEWLVTYLALDFAGSGEDVTFCTNHGWHTEHFTPRVSFSGNWLYVRVGLMGL